MPPISSVADTAAGQFLHWIDNTPSPVNLEKDMVNKAQKIVRLNKSDPSLSTGQIAKIVGCRPEYVRSVGQRKNLKFKSGRRTDAEMLTYYKNMVKIYTEKVGRSK